MREKTGGILYGSAKRWLDGQQWTKIDAGATFTLNLTQFGSQ